MILQTQGSYGFGREGKAYARSGIERSAHLFVVDENRVNDDFAIFKAKRKSDDVDRVRSQLNTRVRRLIEEPKLLIRIVDLHDAVLQKAVTEHSVDWLTNPVS